MICNYF